MTSFTSQLPHPPYLPTFTMHSKPCPMAVRGDHVGQPSECECARQHCSATLIIGRYVKSILGRAMGAGRGKSPAAVKICKALSYFLQNFSISLSLMSSMYSYVLVISAEIFIFFLNVLTRDARMREIAIASVSRDAAESFLRRLLLSNLHKKLTEQLL